MTRKTIRSIHRAEYDALKNAIHRCHNPKSTYFHNYGGRGIEVCAGWREETLGFYRFFDHVGPRPSDTHSLDRIDNNDGYRPGNVRWSTRDEQQNNRRSNRQKTLDYGWGWGWVVSRGKAGSVRLVKSPNLELNGRRQTILEWAEELGIARATLRQRLLKGWPIEMVLADTLFTPSPNGAAPGRSPRKSRSAAQVVQDCADLLDAGITAISSRVH